MREWNDTKPGGQPATLALSVNLSPDPNEPNDVRATVEASLSPGEYLLRIVHCTDNDASLAPYSVCMEVCEDDLIDDTRQPETGIRVARPLELGAQTAATVYPGGDRDHYVPFVPAAGRHQPVSDEEAVEHGDRTLAAVEGDHPAGMGAVDPDYIRAGHRLRHDRLAEGVPVFAVSTIANVDCGSFSSCVDGRLDEREACWDDCHPMVACRRLPHGEGGEVGSEARAERGLGEPPQFC